MFYASVIELSDVFFVKLKFSGGLGRKCNFSFLSVINKIHRSCAICHQSMQLSMSRISST